MYVACYCRVSTEEQAKYGYSISAQKDALLEYCKLNKYKYDFYVDEGISASSMSKRVALNKLLNNISNYDMMLFTKLDRLSRNVLDANNINKILNENNCTMKAIDEDDIDTSTADGTFIFNLKVSLAQREIEKTSERINFVFENKRLKGEVTSGQKKYGYDIINKHFEINKTEASNIINLYKYFLEVNGSMKETYQYFITNFDKKGYDALYSYLRDTSYIGKYKLYKKEEYIENYIPRIMDDELFYNVQSLLSKKEKYVNKRETVTSLFSGLIYCNDCHIRMYKVQDYRVKKRTIRYACDNASKYLLGSTQKKCKNNQTIREDFIENYLLNNIYGLAKNFITQNNVNLSIKKDNVIELDKIKKIEKKLAKLKELYIEDFIDKETFKNDSLKLKSELDKLKKSISSSLPKSNSNLKQIINLDIEKIYSELDYDEKRTFWLSIIDKIYVDKAEIKEVIFL